MRSTATAITDPSCISAARRHALELAAKLQWNDEDRGRVALVTTEAATNLVKHARGGSVVLNAAPPLMGDYLQVISIDRGPGMNDVERCMADGYSTAGSPGTGLGAIRRLSDRLDIVSTPGKGTVLVAGLRARSAWTGGGPPERVGGICTPLTGETLGGDAWDAAVEDGRMALIALDGLGHGPAAAKAADEGVAAFRRDPFEAPRAMIARLHDALRPTRGAAAAVALIDRHGGVLRYAGIGNITGVIVTPTAARHLVSHNGTLGHAATRIAQYEYPWSDHSTLVLHSDGIRARWRPEEWPGLWQRTPTLIAGTIYRDYLRERDDATVVVARHS